MILLLIADNEAKMNTELTTNMPKTVLVTGGAGFIGSAFLNLLVPRFPNINFVNLDSLTYAANLTNLKSIDSADNYDFFKADITNDEELGWIFAETNPDWVIHFAAESHVDRSIKDPGAFIRTNVIGTYNLLETCRKQWDDRSGKLFHHVSTDEVYGSLGPEGLFSETTPYDPRSPYSASKASSDHLVSAYHHTYGLPVKTTNCSNNYGPMQFPEKLIPLMILNASEGKPLPIYGKGENVRDWLFVDDHCEAIWQVATRGRFGETYNIGGNSERTNMEVVTNILRIVGERTGKGNLEDLITYVTDRPGHDLRYAIDAAKIKDELGWTPSETFESGLERTVAWYLDNPEWVEGIRTGAYREWIESNYTERVNP
jgi:dTDP-glucose 4,6-dehydratase